MARLPRALADGRRVARVELISDLQHYDPVMSVLSGARVSVWIGTANVKDTIVAGRNIHRPFSGAAASLPAVATSVRQLATSC